MLKNLYEKHSKKKKIGGVLQIKDINLEDKLIFECPLSMKSFLYNGLDEDERADPVIASDGVTYDRDSIQQVINLADQKGVSPLSPVHNIPISNSLVPNRILLHIRDNMQFVYSPNLSTTETQVDNEHIQEKLVKDDIPLFSPVNFNKQIQNKNIDTENLPQFIESPINTSLQRPNPIKKPIIIGHSSDEEKDEEKKISPKLSKREKRRLRQQKEKIQQAQEFDFLENAINKANSEREETKLQEKNEREVSIKVNQDDLDGNIFFMASISTKIINVDRFITLLKYLSSNNFYDVLDLSITGPAIQTIRNKVKSDFRFGLERAFLHAGLTKEGLLPQGNIDKSIVTNFFENYESMTNREIINANLKIRNTFDKLFEIEKNYFIVPPNTEYSLNTPISLFLVGMHIFHLKIPGFFEFKDQISFCKFIWNVFSLTNGLNPKYWNVEHVDIALRSGSILSAAYIISIMNIYSTDLSLAQKEEAQFLSIINLYHVANNIKTHPSRTNMIITTRQKAIIELRNIEDFSRKTNDLFISSIHRKQQNENNILFMNYPPRRLSLIETFKIYKPKYRFEYGTRVECAIIENMGTSHQKITKWEKGFISEHNYIEPGWALPVPYKIILDIGEEAYTYVKEDSDDVIRKIVPRIKEEDFIAKINFEGGVITRKKLLDYYTKEVNDLDDDSPIIKDFENNIDNLDTILNKITYRGYLSHTKELLFLKRQYLKKNNINNALQIAQNMAGNSNMN